MNETLIEQIQADASALDIKITAQEIAVYLSEKKVPPEHLEAVKEFTAYLRQNQRDKAINALLQHSRIPQKEPSTFENFDFSRVTGENADQIRNLPNLTALYSRQNIAFIGPPGVGKTHLSMAYGNSCCRKGLKTYLNDSSLNEAFCPKRSLKAKPHTNSRNFPSPDKKRFSRYTFRQAASENSQSRKSTPTCFRLFFHTQLCLLYIFHNRKSFRQAAESYEIHQRRI